MPRGPRYRYPTPLFVCFSSVNTVNTPSLGSPPGFRRVRCPPSLPHQRQLPWLTLPTLLFRLPLWGSWYLLHTPDPAVADRIKPKPISARLSFRHKTISSSLMGICNSSFKIFEFSRTPYRRATTRRPTRRRGRASSAIATRASRHRAQGCCPPCAKRTSATTTV